MNAEKQSYRTAVLGPYAMGDNEDGDQFTQDWWKKFMLPLLNLRRRRMQQQEVRGQLDRLAKNHPKVRETVKSMVWLEEQIRLHESKSLDPHGAATKTIEVYRRRSVRP